LIAGVASGNLRLPGEKEKRAGPSEGRSHVEKLEVEILSNALEGLTNSLDFYILEGTSVSLWSQKRRGEK